MDQLDERDRQAFMELNEKMIEQTTKKKQVLHIIQESPNLPYSSVSLAELSQCLGF